MTIEITAIQRLRGKIESAFATDDTGTMGNFTDIPVVEGSISATIDQPMLNPETAQQHLDGYPTQVLGPKACTLSFSMILAPTGASAGDQVAAQESALGMILKAVMGTETLGSGTTVNDVSPAASAFTVATGTNLTQGQAIGWINSSSEFEARPILTRASADLTMALNFSAAPANSDDIYTSACYSLSQDPTSTLQFVLEGAELQNRWVFLACQLESMTIDLPIGELPKITFSFKGAQYIHGADAATDLTATALAVASYTLFDPIYVEGKVYIQTAGTKTLPSASAVQSITISPSLSYGPVTSPSGTNTVARWRRLRSAPVISGDFTEPYQDQTHFTTRDNKTLKSIFIQIGETAGSVILITLPKVQFTNVQVADQDSISALKVEFQGQTDSNTGGTTDLSKSAFRIEFL